MPRLYPWNKKELVIHVQFVVRDVSDCWGVHINCGVPNYCFYLVATSISPEYALRLWYKVLTQLPNNATFTVFGRLLMLLSNQNTHVINAVETTQLMNNRN